MTERSERKPGEKEGEGIRAEENERRECKEAVEGWKKAPLLWEGK